MEQKRESELRDGYRLRKNQDQMGILREEFAKTQVWSYSMKVRIGERAGLTFH